MLGGKTRPVLFGNAAFRKAKESGGLTPVEIWDALGRGDLSVLADIVYPALRVGEYAQKMKPDDFTEMDVAVWIDETPGALKTLLTWLKSSIEQLGEGLDGIREQPAEAKKKKHSGRI